MWDRVRQFTTRMSKERATKRAVRKFFDGFLKGTQCKIIIRGSKGDLLGCRWYFCHLQEGHPGPHKDPYDRDFRSDLHIRHIRHGQMPCEFIKKVDPPRKDDPGICVVISSRGTSVRIVTDGEAAFSRAQSIPTCLPILEDGR